MNLPFVGARPTPESCSFTVWAPLRKQVDVVLKDSRTAHAMVRDELGYWKVNVAGIGNGARYWFRLDSDKLLPDPASRSQPDSVHGASAVVEDSYPWTDNGWEGLPMAEMVLYELHVGTFTPSRNFDGVISKLSYLKQLGVNAIELMPVGQFPGTRNWGYDGVFPFAVQHSYGGPLGLKKLVDAAHRSGISVILDVVYNHLGPEGNYLDEYGPYFTDKYKTGWGKAINFDDAWCDGVRNFYVQNALMWLDEFHIDGLRLDAVHAIWDFSARHFLQVLAEEVRALERRLGRRKLLIAEFDLNNPRYIQPKEIGGYGLDGQWIDEFHHALHVLLTNEIDGYYEDFGTTDHLVRAFRDGYVYTGQFSVHRKKYFGALPDRTTCDQFVVFAQNHDQVGNRMRGDRLSTSLSKGALKLAAATYLLSPYVPLIFMGEEYGEQRPFQYFVDHSDKELIEAVRKGRREEFARFHWKGEAPDPQSAETFKQSMLSWDVERNSDARELFAFYQFVIHFRNTHPAMRGNTRESINVTSAGQVVSVERTHDGESILVVLHFGKESKQYTLSNDRSVRVLFDSTVPIDAVAGRKAVDAGSSVELAPLSATVFEYL